MNEETTTPKIYSALIAVNQEVEAVKKERKNKEQNYSFRGIDDAYNELHDLFAKHGIIVLSKYIDSYREERKSKLGTTIIYSIATYEFTFMAEDGSREMIILQGEGMDTGDKSLNKAFSAALKYALFSMFLIPTDEFKDSENESHEVKPKQPESKPVEKPIERKPISDTSFAKLCDAMRAASDKKAADKIYIGQTKYYTFDDQQTEIINQIIDNHE